MAGIPHEYDAKLALEAHARLTAVLAGAGLAENPEVKRDLELTSLALNTGAVDWEQVRLDKQWPTPRNLHRIADAVDVLCLPMRAGDVLRHVGYLADASLPMRKEIG